MLRLDQVKAWYGAVQVLFGIDLEVNEGEIVALLGTNGAGKTTILRVISGVLRPVVGRVALDGQSLLESKPGEIVRRGVLQMPGGRGVFPGMTVQENLEIGGFLYGRNRERLRSAVDRVFETFPALAERRRQAAGSLSGGEQQMLTL
ncbi:MAG: ABC transporter ATP-binding protein, partial [Actinomycetota bacterium]